MYNNENILIGKIYICMHVIHIACIDELHKKDIMTYLAKNYSYIKIIDLDRLQQQLTLDNDIITIIKQCDDINNKIQLLTGRIDYLNSVGIDTSLSVKSLAKYEAHKKHCLQKYYNLWQDRMVENINNDNISTTTILFGYNIHPDNYSIIVNFSCRHHILVDMDSKKYASRQIKYYLEKYQKKIIEGKFSLELLDLEYIRDKYMNIYTYYDDLGYTSVSRSNILKYVNNILEQEKVLHNVTELFVYATYSGAHRIEGPLTGYYSKNDLLGKLSDQQKKSLFYIYKVLPDTFKLYGVTLIADYATVIEEECYIY
jgi:hypothetical protein